MNITSDYNVRDYVVEGKPKANDRPFEEVKSEIFELKPVSDAEILNNNAIFSDKASLQDNSYTATDAYQQVDAQRTGEAEEEDYSWLTGSKAEEDEVEKTDGLIDYLLKELDKEKVEEDSEQSKEEKGAQNLAIMYEMSNQIRGGFAGRLMTGDALNEPHLTYWM